MKPTAKYFLLTLKHKWFVFLEGLRVGVPMWRLIIHDWTKFMPSELPHYGRQFFGKADDAEGFIGCWVKHQNRHPHHWEYWIPRTGHNRCNPPYKDNMPIPMPHWAVKEMLADWLGASWAYGGARINNVNVWYWYDNNYDKNIKNRLHPITRLLLHQCMCSLIAKYNKENY